MSSAAGESAPSPSRSEGRQGERGQPLEGARGDGQGEAYGPLLLRRLRKEDGRALIVYNRAPGGGTRQDR